MYLYCLPFDYLLGSLTDKTETLMQDMGLKA